LNIAARILPRSKENELGMTKWVKITKHPSVSLIKMKKAIESSKYALLKG